MADLKKASVSDSVGKTRSGKTVYSKPDNPSHSKFDSDDHRDAYTLHKEAAAEQKENSKMCANGSRSEAHFLELSERHGERARIHLAECG